MAWRSEVSYRVVCLKSRDLNGEDTYYRRLIQNEPFLNIVQIQDLLKILIETLIETYDFDTKNIPFSIFDEE